MDAEVSCGSGLRSGQRGSCPVWGHQYQRHQARGLGAVSLPTGDVEIHGQCPSLSRIATNQLGALLLYCRRGCTTPCVIPSRTSGVSVSPYARWKVYTNLVSFSKLPIANDARVYMALRSVVFSLAWTLASGQLRLDHDTVDSGKTFTTLTESFL